MSDALLNALAEALAGLVTAVETSDEDTLDRDTAVKWLESTGHALSGLGHADRRTLDGLFRAAALREPPGPWRDGLLTVPAGLRHDDDAHPALLDEEARIAPEATRLALDDGAHLALVDAVAERAGRYADTVGDADPATPVPTCPGWTLGDLTRHLGTVHGWAEHLVTARPATRVRAGDLPLDPPADPSAYPGWFAARAQGFTTAARTADPAAPVWSPGADPSVRHYPRHLLAETVVHLADAEIALTGSARPIDPGTAAAALDHFLTTAPYIPWIAEPLAHLDRDGAVLRLAARDSGAVWTLVLGGGGFTWSRSGTGAEPTASVTADAGELLLLLHRRYAPDDPRFTRTGDRDLLDDWLAASAL
ncbi:MULTISPECIES: maleylpyruvate isomerase N-terminal domain-containing protein [Streptomyces]|uniref:Maleylpyruvate isomerase N-terminal domain-containing protein n=2 Tax=Streptomyces TaxID=1883 RepID=A0ABU4K0I7_9ACTN|nr:maleylpyruvate isomerase N-terminal domain-containing protein [Streptomyces roseolus]MDX2291276.1 maleylpyruvate isomerase N-terminal domain-containing protein [Streptomyces roseolus]